MTLESPLSHEASFSLKKIGASFFILGVFCMPFDCLEKMPHWFGEFSAEGAFYPLAIAVVIAGINIVWKRQILVPNHISFYFFALFLFWVLISGVVNYHAISESFTKGRSGLNKYLLQYVVLLFVFSLSIGCYQLCREAWGAKLLMVVNYTVLVSFLICAAYSLTEIFYFCGFKWSERLLLKINALYQVQRLLWPSLRSVCWEPSWFGSYFAFVYPGLLACFFTGKRGRLFYLIVIVFSWVMIYLTYSRTAYFTAVAETFLFVLLMLFTRAFKARRKIFYVFIVSLMVFSGSVFVAVNWFPNAGKKGTETFESLYNQDTTRRLSNVARFGAMDAAVRMGYFNPIFGVGLGQYAFHMPEYVQGWALESVEIRDYIAPDVLDTWAHSHCLFTRIFAETGVTGLLLWLSLWFSLAVSLSKKINQADYYDKLWPILLLTTLLGVIAQGFNLGTFRFIGYWVLLPVLWVYYDCGVDLKDKGDCDDPQ